MSLDSEGIYSTLCLLQNALPMLFYENLCVKRIAELRLLERGVLIIYAVVMLPVCRKVTKWVFKSG
ncbi:MAG TPA: hypothetical protein DCY51_10295 [Bacteroidetes bacterium]|nr:hypothetical protein [Bacteroidota bacterium]